MKLIVQWPEDLETGLPAPIQTRLIELLIEPFGDAESAKGYWQEHPTTLVIVEATEGAEALHGATPGFINQLKYAFNYPEFSEPVGQEYQLRLAITSDDGSGIYLLIHNDAPLLKEIQNV